MTPSQRLELKRLADLAVHQGELTNGGAWTIAEAVPALLAQLDRAEEVIRYYADRLKEPEGHRARTYLQSIEQDKAQGE